MRRWRVIIGGLALLAIVLLAWFLVRTGTPWLERQVTASLLAALETGTGCDARLESLTLEYLPARLTLAGLEVDCGAKGQVRIPAAAAEFKLLPLLRRRYILRDLWLREPVVTWRGNLPWERPPGDDRGQDVPVLRVHRFTLSGGRLQLELPGEAGNLEVAGLQARTQRLWDGQRLQVDLQGHGAAWNAGWAEVADISFTTRVGWDGERLNLGGLEISAAAGLELAGDGAMTFPEAGAGATYSFKGSATAPAPLLQRLALLPAGIAPRRAVSWQGELVGEGDDWSVRGDLDAGEVLAYSLPLRQARAVDFSFSPTAGLAARISALTLDGRVEGRLDGAAAAGAWALGGELTATDLDLAGMPAAWPWLDPVPRPASRLSGTLTGRVPLDHPGQATLRGAVELKKARRGPGVHDLAPSGRFQAYLEDGVLHLEEARLTAGEAEFTAAGQVGLDGNLDIRAEAGTSDLVSTLMRLGQDLPFTGQALSGLWDAHGGLTGTWRDPILTAQLQGHEILLQGFPLGRLDARFTWTADGLRVGRATVAGPAADLQFHGARPAAGAGMAAGVQPFTLTAQLERIDLAVLGRLAGRQDLMAGELQGEGQLTWTDGLPQVRVALSGNDLQVAGRPLDRLLLVASHDAGALHVENFSAWRGEGSLQVRGVLPLTATGQEPVEAPSLTLSVEDFPLADQWPGIALGGRLSAAGQVSLSLDEPRPRGQVTLAVRGLLIEGWPIPDLTATVEMGEDQDRATLTSSEPKINLQARMDRTAGYPWVVEGTSDGVKMALPVDMPGLILGGGHATLSARGLLADPESLRGTLSVHELALDTPAGPLTAQGALTISATGRDLRLAPLTLRFGEEEVEILGDAELARVPRYRVQAVGLSNLANWAFLTGGEAEFAGTAVLDVRLEGVGLDHEIFGDLVVRAGRLRLPHLFPNALDQIDAQATLQGNKIVLDDFSGRLGGGRLAGSGQVELNGLQPGRFNMLLRSERVASRYPRAVRSITDTDLELSGTPGDVLLAGRVDVLRAKYEKDFNIERSLQSRTPPSLPPPPGPLDKVRLDLQLVAPGQLWIDNDFARAEFRADLHVGGTASRPIAEGHVNLIRSGRLTFRDVHYEIDGAVLTLSPTFPNDPEMNILARTDISSYTVSLAASGRLSRPQIHLSSDPDLAQDEIVTLLLTGSLPDSVQQTGISSDTLAGYLGGALFPTQTLQRFTSIDQARIDPVFVEGQGDPTARLTLTERLSSRLTASWSTTLGGVQGNTAELRYRVLPHLELRTAQEETGASVVEGRYVRSLPSKIQRRYRRQQRQDEPEETSDSPRSKVILGAIRLEGVPSTPGNEALLAAMGIETGMEIASGDILHAGAVAREFLLGEGYRMARVDCAADEEPAGPAVDVICRVAAGPVIALRLEGARRKNDVNALIAEIHEEWMEVLGEEELPAAAAGAAVAWYLEQGHAAATATGAFVDDQESVRAVQVDLIPGPQVRVGKVLLTGIDELDEKLLRRHLLTAGRVTLRRVLVTPDVVEQDRETLVRLFSGAGYLDVQVESPELEFTSRDEVTVIFRVDAGQRRTIEQVMFSGAHAIPVADLEARFAPALGTPPDPILLEDAAIRLQSYYDSQGYADAAVVWRLERSTDGAVVRFDIHEGEPIRVGQIVIQGLEVTREEVVRRELILAPGDLLRRAAMQDLQKKVRDLGLFRSVVVVGRDVPGDVHTRDVVIRVKERDNLGLAAGLGFDNEEGARISFSLGNRNFLGRGGTLSLQARLSGDIRSGELRNGWRRIGGSRNDFLGAISLSRRDRQGFGVEREALVLQLARPRSSATTIQMRYRIENFNLFDVETFSTTAPADTLQAAFVEEGRLGSLGGSMVRKTFDVPMLPGDGAIRTIDLSIYNEALGSEFEYIRLFIKQGRVWSSEGNRLAYLLTGNVGFMWPTGSTEAVPLAERFFAGGISSVRGYEQDRLGPRDPTTGEPVGGESLFVANNELRIRLTDNLSARLFADAGNVFVQAEDFDLGDLKYSAGPGMSYSTPVGPLRFYYGFKLNREEGQSRGRFHITFGAVF